MAHSPMAHGSKSRILQGSSAGMVTVPDSFPYPLTNCREISAEEIDAMSVGQLLVNKVLHQGFVYKWTNRKKTDKVDNMWPSKLLFRWQLRFVIIYSHYVVYYRDDTDEKPVGWFSLRDYNRIVREEEMVSSDRKWIFKIIGVRPSARTLYFCASSEREMKLWMACFKVTMDHAIHGKVKQTCLDIISKEQQGIYHDHSTTSSSSTGSSSASWIFQDDRIYDDLESPTLNMENADGDYDDIIFVEGSGGGSSGSGGRFHPQLTGVSSSEEEGLTVPQHGIHKYMNERRDESRRSTVEALMRMLSSHIFHMEPRDVLQNLVDLPVKTEDKSRSKSLYQSGSGGAQIGRQRPMTTIPRGPLDTDSAGRGSQGSTASSDSKNISWDSQGSIASRSSDGSPPKMEEKIIGYLGPNREPPEPPGKLPLPHRSVSQLIQNLERQGSTIPRTSNPETGLKRQDPDRESFRHKVLPKGGSRETPPAPQPSSSKERVLEDEPWYHGALFRQETEALLKNEGDFIVRLKGDMSGQYVLSCRCTEKQRHFPIVQQDDNTYRLEGGNFSSVQELIYHHMNTVTPVTRSSNAIIRSPIQKVRDEHDPRHQDIILGRKLGANQSAPNFPTGGGGGRSKQSREKIVISRPSASQDAQLKRSKNAWKPDTKKEEDADAELLKQFKSILNKLTPQNFAKLMAQTMALPINTEERLKGVIDLVFEKAIMEPGFSQAYANMCRVMQNIGVKNAEGVPVQFRKLIIIRCQKQFEKQRNEEQLEKERQRIAELPTDKERAEATEQMNYQQMIAKKQIIGNIRFIGELFKLQLLTEKIMQGCIFLLLKAKDEESLECMSKLVSTIGLSLDHPKGKALMDQYFQQVDKIIEETKVSSRIRFMLQDLKDLRSSNWVARREEAKPMTIDQIRKDAKKDKHRKEQEKLVAQFSRLSPMRSMEKYQSDVDGWNTVPGGRATKQNVIENPSKLKITRQNIDENVQLGPGGRPGSFGGWGKGSSGGGGIGGGKSLSSSEKVSQGNRYQALEEKRSMLPPRDPKGRSSSASKRSMEREIDRPRQSADRFAGSQRSRSNEIERKQEKRPEPTPSISEDEYEKRSRATIEEYINLKDFKEAISCIEELKAPTHQHILIRVAVEDVLEKSSSQREAVGRLFHRLLNTSTIDVQQFTNGLGEVLEFADDMAIDIPMYWTYLGEIIGGMAVEGATQFAFLRDTILKIEGGNAAKFMAEIMKAGAKFSEELSQSGGTSSSPNIDQAEVTDVDEAAGSDENKPDEVIEAIIRSLDSLPLISSTEGESKKIAKDGPPKEDGTDVGGTTEKQDQAKVTDVDEAAGSDENIPDEAMEARNRSLDSLPSIFSTEGERLAKDGPPKTEKQDCISIEGGTVEIPETGVKLEIPAGALSSPELICLRIIPHWSLQETCESFSDNSSVVLELLPNNLQFKHPVKLWLPHCLHFIESAHLQAKVFLSHHDKDAEPNWEEQPDILSSLERKHCSIWLPSFCWVKVEIDDKLVEAKKLVLYGVQSRRLETLEEVEIGYYLNLPGEGMEIINMNRESMGVVDVRRKPFLFLREGAVPLQIQYKCTVPKRCQLSEGHENPKTFAFKDIACTPEGSYSFLFERIEKSECLCYFDARQEPRKIELSVSVKAHRQYPTSWATRTEHSPLNGAIHADSGYQHYMGACGGMRDGSAVRRTEHSTLNGATHADAGFQHYMGACGGMGDGSAGQSCAEYIHEPLMRTQAMLQHTTECFHNSMMTGVNGGATVSPSYNRLNSLDLRHTGNVGQSYPAPQNYDQGWMDQPQTSQSNNRAQNPTSRADPAPVYTPNQGRGAMPGGIQQSPGYPSHRGMSAPNAPSTSYAQQAAERLQGAVPPPTGMFTPIILDENQRDSEMTQQDVTGFIGVLVNKGLINNPDYFCLQLGIDQNVLNSITMNLNGNTDAEHKLFKMIWQGWIKEGGQKSKGDFLQNLMRLPKIARAFVEFVTQS